MKIEKLTENKIRIILNIDDLAKKNISLSKLSQNTDEAQKLFKSILKEAEKEVGFNTSDSKLMIEAFASTDGFFVVTFTKLDSSPDLFKSKKPKAKRKSPCFSCNNAIYKFDSFEEFCNFCTYLNSIKLDDLKKFAKCISLYEYNSTYFLVFSDINRDFTLSGKLYVAISEFAKLVSNSDKFKSKLVEYGKVVFKNNAIKQGSAIFK